jgi:hypothetical protein
MARQERQAEGDNEQRRKTAKEARDRGRRPSEVGATLGASKQRKEARRQASHQERLEQKREGKRSRQTETQARPGNREIDPNRG